MIESVQTDDVVCISDFQINIFPSYHKYHFKIPSNREEKLTSLLETEEITPMCWAHYYHGVELFSNNIGINFSK